MTTWRALLAAVLLSAVNAPTSVHPQDVGAIRSEVLVIDLERLFEQSEMGARMVADHQAEREALAGENERLTAELEAEERRLTDLRPDTSAEEFREMADAFDARVQQTRQDFDRRNQDLTRKRERLPRDFLTRVNPVFEDLMRAYGGLILLDRRSVILRADAVDITERAIARINAEFGDGSLQPEE